MPTRLTLEHMFGVGFPGSSPNRRYSPTPYPPHSEATRIYRDSWDLGWEHYATLRAQVLDHERNLPPGPGKHGYRDGVIARYMYEERERAADVKAAQAEFAQRRLRMRAEAESERPY